MKTIVAVGLTVAAALAVGCGGGAAPTVEPASTVEATHASPSDPQARAARVLPSAIRCEEVGRFEVNNAAVVDPAARKAWQRDVDPQRRTQADAAAYCASLGIDDRGGWRLPAVDELTQIRLLPSLTSGDEAHHCVPSIDQSAFPDTPASEFWTSSTRGDFGVYTDFADGRSHDSDPTATFYVRCVRDVEPSPADMAAASRTE